MHKASELSDAVRSVLYCTVLCDGACMTSICAAVSEVCHSIAVAVAVGIGGCVACGSYSMVTRSRRQ